jgi:enoyl-CoA hydratase
VSDGSGAPRIDVVVEERGAAGRIARVVVDHQAKLNILNRFLIIELGDKLEALAGDEGLRAVVLTGGGARAFIGGADIRDMAALDQEGARAFIAELHRACAALRSLPVPVIARICGYALGAGLEVAASCDLRVAEEGARFGMPEVKVGIPSVIEAALLPSLIGWGRTRRLLFTGETIGAGEAERWGLVDWCVPAPTLDDTIEQVLSAILACGPAAIRLQKALIGEWEELPLWHAVARGIVRFADAYKTDEPKRMMQAFLAGKAKPR